MTSLGLPSSRRSKRFPCKHAHDLVAQAQAQAHSFSDDFVDALAALRNIPHNHDKEDPVHE